MRILIVEDEEKIAKSLQQSLNSECFETDIAGDGALGLEMALSRHYDLIILDNALPKKTGLEVCQEFRKSGKSIPILILSVLLDSNSKTKFLNAGADDYLTKPFAFTELLARVRALLRRPPIIANEILSIDDLILDSKKHTVIRKNINIYLTRKEFMFLELLMRNIGIVMSRAVIMEQVWDANIDPFSNTIESHVVSLRHKIDFTGSKKLIHTVSGRGYKIDCRP